MSTHYDKDRDNAALGKFYTDHVLAMTREGLHKKSDIASELAVRDMEIARLTECLARANASSEKFEREWYLRGDVLDATEYRLGSLLAVIHRDGGHYQTEHGTEKACADAELAVHVQRGIADGYHDAIKIWRHRAEQLAIEADAEIAGLRADAERIDAQWRDELRIYRESENARIAELEQAVAIRDTEIARLETDLELARRDADYLRLFARIRFGYAPGDYFGICHYCKAQFIGDKRAMNCEACADKAIDAARAGNGGEG